MGIGIVIGAAFTSIVNSFVKDIVNPIIGVITGGIDFSNLFINLGSGEYASLAAAQEAGAPTINYGLFLNNVVALLLIAMAMFLIIRAINRVDELLEKEVDTEAEQAPNNKKCPYCRETIAYRATRCPHCTSELEQAPVKPESRG